MTSYKMFTTRVTSDAGHLIITDGVAITATPTLYSNKLKGDPDAKLGWTLKTTGTLTLAFSLWYSDMENPDVADDDDWTEDESWTPTDPAGSATKVKYSVDGVKTVWWRIKAIVASGAGTLYGYAAGQGDR